MYHETIARPEQAVRATVMALKTAYSRRGAAMLSLPTDVLSEKLNEKIWLPEEHIFKPGVATTSRAKGVVPETHPLAVGVLGSLGTLCAAEAVTKSDLIIIAGSSFREKNLMPDIPVIQIDINGVHLGKSIL